LCSLDTLEFFWAQWTFSHFASGHYYEACLDNCQVFGAIGKPYAEQVWSMAIPGLCRIRHFFKRVILLKVSLVSFCLLELSYFAGTSQTYKTWSRLVWA